MIRGLAKKLFYSTLILLLWLGFVVEGSHALLSDSAALAGNSITTGSADLVVSNSQSPTSTTYADSRPGFPLTLVPGQADEHFFLLKNMSSSNVPLAIDASAVVQDGDSTFPPNISLEFTPVDGSGTPTGAPVTSTLKDLEGQNLNLGTTLAPGQFQRYRLHTTLEIHFAQQGINQTYDLVFTGTENLAS